jgi:putative hydrolase of the HAD superfamily
MSPKAYIFDLDGTLIDQEAAEREALEELFKADILLDPMPHFSAFIRVWRNIAEDYLNAYLRGKMSLDEQRVRRVKDLHTQFGREIGDEEARGISKKYLRHYEAQWRAFEDSLPALQALKGSHRLGIITNGDSAQQRSKIKKCGLEPFFEKILVSSEAPAPKPDKAIFEHCQGLFGLEAADMAYVGDRLETDALAAKASGWQGVWINRKHMPSGDAESGIRVISGLTELLVKP